MKIKLKYLSGNIYQATINTYLHNKEKLLSILTNLQTNLFRIDVPNMDQHTMYKWLFCGPKYCKDNQSHSLKHPSRIS